MILNPGGFQLRQVRVGEESADIAVAGFERSNLGGIIRHEAEEDLIQLGPAEPVVLVGSKRAKLPDSHSSKTNGPQPTVGALFHSAVSSVPSHRTRAAGCAPEQGVPVWCRRITGQPGGIRFLESHHNSVSSGVSNARPGRMGRAMRRRFVGHDHLVGEFEVGGGDRRCHPTIRYHRAALR